VTRRKLDVEGSTSKNEAELGLDILSYNTISIPGWNDKDTYNTHSYYMCQG
jgi:hypothetical protein